MVVQELVVVMLVVFVAVVLLLAGMVLGLVQVQEQQ